MLLMQLIMEIYHGNTYYRLDIEGLWHRCYKVVKMAPDGILDRNEVFASMLSKCCTLKRACERAGRLPVRLSVPVSARSLSYDVLHAWACSARLSVHSSVQKCRKSYFWCQGPRFKSLRLITHPWYLENNSETLHGNRYTHSTES